MFTSVPDARWLRQHHTDAEKLLWSCLRRKQLGGWRFRRQHGIGNFIVDFCCPQARLAVELDGGHHSRQATYDEQRTQHLQHFGYQLLRFWNQQVLHEPETVLAAIWSALPKEPGK